jgi:kinesin family protein 20
MDYFSGDGGRAVMIVNVNPYDTGFDENAHVMKFAALAREVYTTPVPAATHVRTKIQPARIGTHGAPTLSGLDIAPFGYKRKVTLGSNVPFPQVELEIVEGTWPLSRPSCH